MIDLVKQLNDKRREVLELEEKIKKFSIYNIEEIAPIIQKLIIAYEGVPYKIKHKHNFIDEEIYDIESEIDNYYIYKTYTLKIMKKNKETVFLPPTGFIIEHFISKNNFYYINNFIDYLFIKRVDELLYEITNEQLEELLNDFLNNTINEQIQKQEENKRKIKEIDEFKRRQEFENGCLIDRKTIFKAILHIVNKYENQMSATKIYETEEKYCDFSMYRLYLIEKLVIKTNEEEVEYETVIDSNGCQSDEIYCTNYPSDKDTNIRFFELKESILSILKNCNYLNIFMEKVEELYNEKKVLDIKDIEPLIIEISNQKRKVKRNDRLTHS